MTSASETGAPEMVEVRAIVRSSVMVSSRRSMSLIASSSTSGGLDTGCVT